MNERSAKGKAEVATTVRVTDGERVAAADHDGSSRISDRPAGATENLEPATEYEPETVAVPRLLAGAGVFSVASHDRCGQVRAF